VTELFRVAQRSFERNELLIHAAAATYQVLFALVPLTLCSLSLLGFFDLKEWWSRMMRQNVKPHLSQQAYELVNGSAQKIVSQHEVWWLTAGALLALWTVGTAIRTLMRGLNKVYEVEERRGFAERLLASTVLALVTVALLGGALVVARFGSAIIGQEGAGDIGGLAIGVLRSAIAGALLLAAVGVMLRYAPAERRPAHWATAGSLIVVVGWAVWSGAFAWYASSIADYQSIFGSLATVIVLMTYVHMSVVTFLVGAQVDVLIEAEAQESI
jgi:membrane protein